jgi:hypothetical protein
MILGTRPSTGRPAPSAASIVLALLALACAGPPRQDTPPPAAAPDASDAFVASPDGRVAVHFRLGAEGEPAWSVSLDGRTILEPSPLGLVTSVASWERRLEEVERGQPEPVEDRYRLLHGKCSACTYVAHRRTVRLADPDGRVLEIVFQVSDDGVALRYRIPEGATSGTVTARRELTGFRLPAEARSWLMPMDDPASGWMNVNPAYEAHYVMDAPVGAPSPTGVGWAFPALFRVPDAGWALVTEAGMDGTYVASRLRAEEGGLYRIAFPEPGEGTGPDDPVEPSFTLPFASPWRLVIVGEGLAPIVESTLVTDVSPPSVLEDTGFVQPGKASWSWLPLKDESMVPDVQRAFVDLAADQGYPYVLVDGLWDVNLGYDGVEELVGYARGQGVGVLLWYNSNGRYNDAPQTPRDRMHETEVRRSEFRRLQAMGVRGVKVDFFGGDKQSVVRHYVELIRDAADHELMVNVHGATLPRGWSRTYPNFMTAEAVRGYEFITFGQADADRGPSHATVLPFTRNAVGPMDFTPTMFGERVGASVRRTSDAFDLAMNVVFESGIQHLGVTPESLARVPDHVRRYLSEVPVAWDETRFLDGWPGELVVLARRKGERWYLGGLNGSERPRTVELDLSFVEGAWEGTLLTDGDDARSVRQETIARARGPLRVELGGHGGFAAVLAPPG